MAKYNKNGFITELDDNEIFVFGSNKAGRHGAGAAKQAHDYFGAEYGVGEGITGQCYAFPTLDKYLQPLEWYELLESRDRLFNLAYLMEDTGDKSIFLLTKVGCGLAKYSEHKIKSMFKDTPSNIIKPEDWR